MIRASCHPERPYKAKGKCTHCYSRNAEFKRALIAQGITLEEFERMLELQGGVCAICKKLPVGKTRLSIDHDHKTKRVRGLLCAPCNWALGYFYDDPELCVLGADYLLGAALQ